ncbi:MAG: amidophosphoribosyltransferase [Proteobacteria bacterium]|nr:amidophosphoribosyltransferase [Pseudomonadota bacterium]MBU2260884.1 amidophosphoribosyltransferase [Pseudomonadota bacterium]
MGGIFGCVSEQCAKDLFYGTDYHSHLGTENAGLAIFGADGFGNTIHSISQAQFKSRFVDDYKTMQGDMGIGAIDDESPQPLLIRSKFGTYALAATGLITNKDDLARKFLREGASFSEMAGGGVNSVELVAKLINRGDDIVDGILRMQNAIEGSVCLLLMNAEGIYAARDRYGRFPLSIGKEIRPDGSSPGFAAATEASSFPNLGYELIRSLGPGEIVRLDRGGVRTEHPAGEERHVCAFLWIYTGDPASVYEGISVENARERCGRAMARGDEVGADLVAGIPDSGVGHAIGYAMESGLPYRRPLVKYTPGYGRSYTPPSQDIRDIVATMKLNPVRDVIHGSRMVICDDSIVRGTQLKNYTIRKLWDNGAKELHIRPACPPLMFPCRYASSTRSVAELAAHRAIRALDGETTGNFEEYLDHRTARYRSMVEWIRRDLNVTSLKYITIEKMIEAIGLPEEQLCLYCWRGR